MSPHRIEPGVDYQRLNQLAHEFTDTWMRLHALYLDAVAGFSFVRARVDAKQGRSRGFVRGTELDSEEFQDTLTFSYAEIFSEAFCASNIHEATQGEVKARNSPGGSNYITLGNLCILAFVEYWNGHLRSEYVIAKGKLLREEKNLARINAITNVHAKVQLWGDLTLLRNSIVHNQGVARTDVGRCRLVLWFKPGDLISFTPDRMAAVFLALLKYRNDLSAEQYPQHYITIPGSRR